MDGAIGPAVAGTWYPADAIALRDQVEQMLAAAPAEASSGATAALIAPHAGFVYSGPTAAGAFRSVQGARPGRVILIGPSHYAAFAGAALPDATIYRTPLGPVPLDREALAALLQDPAFRCDDAPFLQEHSLEAEIPFLQTALQTEWRLVPVLIGAGGQVEQAQRVANALRPLLDSETLIVVSSDFTHYGPRFGYVPFHRDVPRRIEALDHGAIDRVLLRDVEGFAEYVAATGATICGRNAIDVLLRLLPDEGEGRLSAYDTSGRITGDWTHSVSYAAVVFRHPDPERPWHT